MSKQTCGRCGEGGHNARSGRCRTPHTAPRYSAPLVPPLPMDPNAPIMVAVRQHVERDKCVFCKRALEENADDFGRIRVFIDLCAEGQRAIKYAPDGAAPPLPPAPPAKDPTFYV